MNRCEICGADRDLVGMRHRCIPRKVIAATSSLDEALAVAASRRLPRSHAGLGAAELAQAQSARNAQVRKAVEAVAAKEVVGDGAGAELAAGRSKPDDKAKPAAPVIPVYLQRYLDPPARRAYMREYMRKRRAR